MNSNSISEKQQQLAKLFPTDEDRRGTDLLKMTSFLSRFMEASYSDVNKLGDFQAISEHFVSFVGQLSNILSFGYAIREGAIYVADFGSLSPNLKEGFKSGNFRLQESSKFPGNYTPNIVDGDGKFVGQLTLKKSFNPTNALSSISSFCMQMSLMDISEKLDLLCDNLEALLDFTRRVQLCNPFLYARDKILQAIQADDHEFDELLKEADTYLMEGLTSLYSDLEANAKSLSSIRGIFRSLKKADQIIAWITEDFTIIPQYVGIRAFLFYLLDKQDSLKNVIEDYIYHLSLFAEEKESRTGLSIAEQIHDYCWYPKNCKDYWIDQPTKTLEGLRSFNALLGENMQDMFLVGVQMEEITDEI